MARNRLRQLARHLNGAILSPTASDEKPPPVVGEFDSHEDNGLRVHEMFDSFHGKVALVTGGSIGIGRMIAEGLVVNGCKVYITSRKEEACLATAAELNEIAAGSGGECIGFGSDLSAVEGCELAAEYVSQREEKLHILINNAGATVRL